MEAHDSWKLPNGESCYMVKGIFLHYELLERSIRLQGVSNNQGPEYRLEIVEFLF